MSICLPYLWKWKWSDIRPSMVTHTRNLCSAFDPSKVHTHSSEHTHTVNTHPEQWAAIYAAAPGEQLGVRCLAQGHLSRGIEGERALYIHSPHLQFLPAWDSNSQPFDDESDSLTIRPRLPPIFNSYVSFCFLLSFQPCVQYWPEPGLQQYGPMQVEFLSMSADEDIITRLFRVKNVTRVSSINDNLLSYI